MIKRDRRHAASRTFADGCGARVRGGHPITMWSARGYARAIDDWHERSAAIAADLEWVQ